MPINNSYNQTPKRIFTNKPFIKGMNYTNADLEPFVCRAVANLELESSNSATKLRKGITNNILDTDQGLVYKFYKKFVIFTNLITETMYNNNITPTNVQSADLGIKVINEDKKENDIYETIITNNTKLEYTTELNDSLDLFGPTANYKIYALVSDEGRLNHVINNQDYSFMFFGAIFNNTSIQYKGPIKLYYHVTAQKIIIEIIKPQTLDVDDVNATGVNIVANNPAVYKDWINYQNGPQYYSDYFGDTRAITDENKNKAITDENKNKAIIDITTVALYDAPVEPVPYNNSSNANMLVSIDKTKQDPFYIRPFYAIPNKEYGVMVTAQSKDKLDYIYNFTSKEFETIPNSEININKNFISSKNLIMQDTSMNLVSNINNINKNSTAIISSNTADTVIRLLATDEDISDSTVTSFGFGNNLITSDYVDFQYRIVSLLKYNIDSLGNLYNNNINEINERYSTHEVYHTIVRNDYLYRKSIMNKQTIISGTVSPTFYANDSSYTIKINSNGGMYMYANISQTNYSYTINFPEATKSEIENCISKTSTLVGVGIKLYKTSDPSGPYIPINFNLSNTYYNVQSTFNDGVYTESFNIGGDPSSIYHQFNSLEGDVEDFFTLYGFSESDIPSSQRYLYTKFYIIDERNNTNKIVYINNWRVVKNVTGGSYTVSITDDLVKDYTLLTNTEGSADNLQQQLQINYNDNVLSLTNYFYDFSNFNNISTYTPLAKKLNEYSNSTIENALSNYSVVLAILNSNNNTPLEYNININTNLHYFQINKMNCHYIANDGYSIPINRSILDSIDTSTFKVTLFPYEEFDESSVQYKPDEFVEKPLYSFGIGGEKIVDYSTYKSNPLFSRSLNMTNHLGHTVVWGDHTDSNSLYYSAFNDISYFPSNYIFTFDNPIVYAYPHRDSLVVFTTDDVYMLHSGNVPSTTATDGSEVPFTQSLIQANTRLGKQNIDSVRAIGKDLFFINNNNQGYLLKSNKYVSDVSDVYLIKLTSQIDDLLDNPYQYAKERYMKWYPNSEETSISSKLNTITKITDATPSLTTIDVPDTYEVVDGDTIKFDNQYYRLVYIDTPEVSTNERLAYTAKCVLTKLMAQASNNILYDTGKIDNSEYNRKLVLLMCDNIDVSATMLYNGLAEYYDSSYTEYENNLYSSCYSFAKLNQRGIHNNNKYTELTENDIVIFTEFDGSIDIYNPIWNTNSNELYCYTTNSYVYIIQAIKLSIEKAITIFYKYSIDAKVWTTYDIPTYIKPNDIIPDNNTVGFKILCNNDRRGKASLLEFKNSPQDVIQYKFTKSNDLGEYTLDSDLKYNYINVYFDSGNQSISLMNDKLFREIKLLLGALPDSLLSMDYSIDFYTDGKLVIPNQVGSCDTHIHHRPINTHYKGSVENLEGFQKVTFFAPARGRIPRIVFSLTCESDINILEYAIVYMQLNAK